MPQTDIHKVAGYLAGLLVTWLARKGFNLDVETTTALFVGVMTLVGTIIAKYTNPTGANASDARKVLEAQTGTGSGK